MGVAGNVGSVGRRDEHARATPAAQERREATMGKASKNGDGTPEVSEKFSEPPAKSKSGRPRLFAVDRAICNGRGLFTTASTERHRLNIVYRQRAVSLLMDDPAFAWLCSTEKEINAGTGRIRSTI